MKKRDPKKLTVRAGLLLASFAGVLVAQDESAPAPDAAAADAAPVEEAATEPAAEGGGEESAAEPAAAPVKPRPAEIAQRAANGLMLGVVHSGRHLFVVGDRGTVLVSNNAKDWAQVQTPVRSALTAISFASPEIGYAVGHDAVVLKTSDGGKTWLLQNFQPELEKPFLSVLALDTDNVLAVGAYGLMYRTTDGGSTWNEVDAPDIRGEELHLNHVGRLGDGGLLVVGEQGTIGVSSDGGTTWSKVTSPYDGSLYGSLPIGSGGALIYGLRGNVYRSDDVKVADGGWSKVDLGTVASFFGGTALDSGEVVLVGLAGKAVRLGSDGSTRTVAVTRPLTDANGQTSEKAVTGSFSGVIAWAGRLVLVGEQGVQAAGLN